MRRNFSGPSAAKIVENCVDELRRTHERLSHKKKYQADQNVHLFLHEIFKINGDLSRQYHSLQIELYIVYDKKKLLNFLQSTDAYPPMKAIEMCKTAHLHKEVAYIYFKIGKSDEAI